MNDDDIRPDEDFYIVSGAARANMPTRVLKDGDSFGVFDPRGDMIPSESAEQGFYSGGTRYLSQYRATARPHASSIVELDDQRR